MTANPLEEPIATERANPTEKPVPDERAESNEEPGPGKRAVRIAFSGAHGVGKDTLVEYVAELLGDVNILPSATRWTHDWMQVPHSEERNDWTQLYSAVRRRFWEEEAARQAFPIVSPRCGIDELAYQLTYLEEVAAKAESGLQFPEGSKEYQLQVALLMRSKAVAQVLTNLAEEECLFFWDVIYFKRPDPDHAPEDDGFRSTEVAFQEAVDVKFADLINKVDAFRAKVRVVPRELEAAKMFLKREADKWR